MGTNIRWGIRGGLAISALYCGWVTIVYLGQGSAPFERNGVSFGSIVTTYVVVGLVAGALVGLFRPHLTSKVGAYTAGLVAGTAISFGIVVSRSGFPATWRPANWVSFPVFAIFAGLVIGHELWKSHSMRPSSGPKRQLVREDPS